MKKTSRAEDNCQNEVQDKWKRISLDTSLMTFQNSGLRENPKSHREKTDYFFRQTNETKYIKIKYPCKERETPFVAIWSRTIGAQ